MNRSAKTAAIATLMVVGVGVFSDALAPAYAQAPQQSPAPGAMPAPLADSGLAQHSPHYTSTAAQPGQTVPKTVAPTTQALARINNRLPSRLDTRLNWRLDHTQRAINSDAVAPSTGLQK